MCVNNQKQKGRQGAIPVQLTPPYDHLAPFSKFVTSFDTLMKSYRDKHRTSVLQKVTRTNLGNVLHVMLYIAVKHLFNVVLNFVLIFDDFQAS